ncbi:serine--tRNA ligase [Streptomyces canus]|uniref:serine--tRNA ligase n=1 Tax=Streptomyces canus TaxID=58343 RepID=UPI000749FE7C|nr:serine--tRNA ligase [Streptomyces canus]KUN08145.1 serine--tRNA ligase [Streptomyces canus]
MLDVSLIRKDPEKVRRALEKRAVHVDLGAFLELDAEFRRVQNDIEVLRAERKKLSAQVARSGPDGNALDRVRADSQEIGVRIKELEGRLVELGVARSDFLDPLPNLPDDDVLPGGKEANETLRVVGEKPRHDFSAKDHVELAESLRLVDYARGVKLAGSGFWVYTGAGAMLEWALLNYFVEAHHRDGYEFILPPHILGQEAGYAAGQFPKFAEDVFMVGSGNGEADRFLIPTSETALIALHRDETLPEEELPRRYFAYSPCYRSEIGGYRSTERGTLRGHQFQKVEMVQFAHPDHSDAAHEELLIKAERLVADLGLHYRVTKLAAGDMSGAMARTVDVEVWLPSVGAYMEVSSVSNSRDYQARRGNIRYRPRQGKGGFVHTLNGSGLATSRLLPAILEQCQQADGSVRVPEVLHRWGIGEVLKPTA